jgi:hypothetical protein
VNVGAADETEDVTLAADRTDESETDVAPGTCEWCRTRVATERCPRSQQDGAVYCVQCHAAKRISYPCRCMTHDEAVRIYEKSAAKRPAQGTAPKASAEERTLGLFAEKPKPKRMRKGARA